MWVSEWFHESKNDYFMNILNENKNILQLLSLLQLRTQTFVFIAKDHKVWKCIVVDFDKCMV